MNVAHLLEWSARRHGERVAFTFAGHEQTFAEIDHRSARLAAGLSELGVSKGDRVGILIENRPEYFEAEFAVVKIGAVRVPLLVTLTASELASSMNHAGTTAVIASEQTAAKLREALTMVDHAVTVVLLGGAVDSEQTYEDVIAGSAPLASVVDLVDSDLYAIRVTGGTTGIPKAVAMSHRCMLHVINNMLLNWPMSGSDVVLSVHPLSHASGMVSYPYWARGAKNVIRPAFGFDAEAFLADVETYRATSVFLIPTILNLLLDSPALNARDVSSLRTIIYGGAPIPFERLRQALLRFGSVFIQVYGTTEAPMLLTTLLPEDHVLGDGPVPRRLRSAGREALNVEVRVLLPDGTVAPVGEVGEVVSRGPHTMDGYWENPELTAQRLRDGWVYTGDMGRFDDDGYLYIVDRKEDMIITGGFNVWPAEIEDVIHEHAAVSEAAVFGVEHDRWGEAVIAAVLLRTGAEVNEAELIAFLRERLASYKVPKRVVFRDKPIPRSAVDKHLRRRVREEHADALREMLT